MDIEEHEGKFHVMEEGDVLGVFRTRRGALAYQADQERERTMVAGPWANAARRAQAAQVTHTHQPLIEGLSELTHIHEFDEVTHTHPGYGPGEFADADVELGPGGVEV